MNPLAEIFSQGEELLCGQIVDTNAAWLSGQLTELGFKVKRHTGVGDDMAELVELFKEIAQRADCCICSGGLGPTVDDLTREAVSQASGLPLQFDEHAFTQIQAYFQRRDRTMPEANRKQALLPAGAVRIDNAWGTAPGFALQFQRCWFVFLPGVPAEMQAMFSADVKPQLQNRFSLSPDDLVILRSIGIGESAIQQKLAAVSLPAQVQLGFRASVDEVQTKLLFPSGFPVQSKQALVERIAALIGDFVFAVDDLQGRQGDLLTVIDELMREQKLSLALLETAGQGLAAAKCIGLAWLHSAEICLDQARLTAEWGIAIDLGQAEDSARSLAEQLRQKRQTDLALVQLYQGEQTDLHDKQRGIVLYNALSTANTVLFSRHQVSGPLKTKQNQAALLALDLLRRYLQHKCL